MFMFTGISHFFFTAEMVDMLPPSIPERAFVILVTGVLEVAGAIGLLVPRSRRLAAWCLAMFLVLVFPANIYAAFNETGMGGHTSGPGYLLIRAPLQVAFLIWTVYFGIRNKAESSR